MAEPSCIWSRRRVETVSCWAEIIATMIPKARSDCRAMNSQKPHSSVRRTPRPKLAAMTRKAKKMV